MLHSHTAALVRLRLETSEHAEPMVDPAASGVGPLSVQARYVSRWNGRLALSGGR